MELLKKAVVYFFIALLTIVNINCYQRIDTSIDQPTSNNFGRPFAQLDAQSSVLFSFIEQRVDFQTLISFFPKCSIKISLADWSFDKLSNLFKNIPTEIAYSISSKLIVPGLETITIIYPFHCFW
jgi:hypothetical protein